MGLPYATGPRAGKSLTLDAMNRSRCLGLVGGLGVGATVHYYEKLAQAHAAQGRTPDIVITHAETARSVSISRRRIETD